MMFGDPADETTDTSCFENVAPRWENVLGRLQKKNQVRFHSVAKLIKKKRYLK